MAAQQSHIRTSGGSASIPRVSCFGLHTRCVADPSMFPHTGMDTVCATHADDFVLTGPDEGIDHFFEVLAKALKVIHCTYKVYKLRTGHSRHRLTLGGTYYRLPVGDGELIVEESNEDTLGGYLETTLEFLPSCFMDGRLVQQECMILGSRYLDADEHCRYRTLVGRQHYAVGRRP
eukprot:3318093-Amphidinium_carterae.1